jgi:hypothetical protein
VTKQSPRRPSTRCCRRTQPATAPRSRYPCGSESESRPAPRRTPPIRQLPNGSKYSAHRSASSTPPCALGQHRPEGQPTPGPLPSARSRCVFSEGVSCPPAMTLFRAGPRHINGGRKAERAPSACGRGRPMLRSQHPTRHARMCVESRTRRALDPERSTPVTTGFGHSQQSHHEPTRVMGRGPGLPSAGLFSS